MLENEKMVQVKLPETDAHLLEKLRAVKENAFQKLLNEFEVMIDCENLNEDDILALSYLKNDCDIPYAAKKFTELVIYLREDENFELDDQDTEWILRVQQLLMTMATS